MAAPGSDRFYLAVWGSWLYAFHRDICNFFTRNRLRIEWMALGSEAAPGSQFKLPAMHCAGQHAVLDAGEARQVGFEVGAAALDAIAVALPQLLHCRLLGVVAFGVLQAFRREALEEVVDVLVIGSLTLRLEAAGEQAGQYIRTKCDHCWYNPKDIRETAKKNAP